MYFPLATVVRRTLVAAAILLAAPSLLKAENAAPAPVYYLDLTGLNGLDYTKRPEAQKAWDTLHVASSLQGIVNRDGPRLFLRHMQEADDFWWDYLRGENQWLHGRPVVVLHDVAEAVKTFAPKLKGVVLYDPRVAATSSLASTIAGVEDRLALRYDPAEGSLYDQLSKLPEYPKDVTRLFRPDGSPMFTGEGKIPDLGVDSTGSAKNDAYLWAKARYLDADKCSREFLAYYLDSYWLVHPTLPGQGPNQGLSNTTLANHDYYVGKRAFFFDLGMWPDETPIDDRNQQTGTDLRTMTAILQSMARRNKDHIFTIGGFVPWLWKYAGPDTGWSGSGGKHPPVHSEWEYAHLISSYNGMMDADAMGGMANASFYQHYPLKERYPQQRKPTLADLKARGLVQPDGAVRPGAYVAYYMGDYDAASWFNGFVPKMWTDPQRGKVTCNWGFDPALDRRAPHVMDYVRTHAAATDWFVSGDCGMGYLNPSPLTAPRPDPTLGDGWEAWTAQNKVYFQRYDLSIAGFVIEGFTKPMGKRGMDYFARFAPDGMLYQTSATDFDRVTVHNGVLPVIRHQIDLDGTSPVAAKTLVDLINAEKSHFPSGAQFLMPRTVLKTPTWIADTSAAVKTVPGGERITFLDAYSFFLLMKTQLANEKADPQPRRQQ